MATMASRSAAGICANTFVQRARRGSSVSSPRRWDAESRSVRRASSDVRPGRAEHHGLGPAELRARARDALLVNLANSVTVPLRAGFARTALFDVDPGPFQLWAREHGLGVGEHDVHLTIGQNLGAADSPVPLGGVAWHKVWPAVHLPAWPDQGGTGGACYTTVTQWWTEQYAFLDGETFDCNKRPGFLALLDLPGRVPVVFELD